MTAILLASASPRRLAMLERAGFAVRGHSPEIDESPHPGEDASALVLRLARAKAAAGAAVASHEEVIVAGDTVVALGDEILGKPRDAAEAARMLRALSGREHDVLGGWCVRRGGHELAGVVRTTVRFRPIGEDEIASYIASGEPLGKAGAYAIQERGGAFVAAVAGSFANVVGLPLGAVLEAIAELAP